MNNLIIAPIVLPAVVGPFILMAIRFHSDLQRVFSVASVVLLNLIAFTLLWHSMDGSIQVYELGDWPAPFGIVLVLDRLSAMMVMLTTLLALPVLLYAIGSGWDTRGRHFHALFQFQLMGILGAFLTGDAFNLFVFFEVLLIASYGLMIHGGGSKRLRAGVQYVVYNLLGSSLFLIALGAIYSVTGTLNMADLAVRVAALPVEDTALIRVAAVLLLLVFAIKAAVLPLHFWLPASYANAPMPVAALFAIMTKVGAYAILRMYTLVFGPDVAVTQGLVGDWLLPAALLTLTVGSIGILGAKELGRLVAFSAITSMGTLLIAISLFTPQSAAAALYYAIHSTLTAALLFLVADLVMERRGGKLIPCPAMPQSGLISALYFAGAIAMAGMPPLSGFIGKLLVLSAAWPSSEVWLIFAVVLTTSLITIVGLTRAGSILFWKSHDRSVQPPEDDEEDDIAKPVSPELASAPVPGLAFVSVFALLAGLVALTVLAGPVLKYTEATAGQLFDPTAYIETVLQRP
ncbi:monovalent cation/H+ antiporter subunit D [Pseudodonghicola xiamenensis]|uniref:Monovalent cation/H+ antiporter subunit D n=1 Tax=Pseudodonghicola xiamenensis TaxID=337702 RepID=A0A8J3HCA4_9RHOB|nr:monovalent cation/H+ antiporter subunit D [Pseudodonghicola xiamenensis]GHH01416.1 monovalent cation/H+ antiporter subunit D [Pseudodonghicola xiamenensis]